MRISDWSSDVCSSDLLDTAEQRLMLQFLVAEAHQRFQRGLVAQPIITADLQHLGVDEDRKSVVSGKSVSVRVDLGGRRIIKKKTKQLRKGVTITMQRQNMVETTTKTLYKHTTR